jgi:hypothetical protein
LRARFWNSDGGEPAKRQPEVERREHGGGSGRDPAAIRCAGSNSSARGDHDGAHAATARERMEWIPLQFWSPYPETPDGHITSLWRDPVDGSRWAHGSDPDRREVLRELTVEDAAALEAQGFPVVYTYAIDGDGLIWTSGTMPLERVPCLNLAPRPQFETVTSIAGGLIGHRVIDLPDGWRRIYRLPRDGKGPRVEVSSIDEDDDGLYQRWRDDQTPPT